MTQSCKINHVVNVLLKTYGRHIEKNIGYHDVGWAPPTPVFDQAFYAGSVVLLATLIAVIIKIYSCGNTEKVRITSLWLTLNVLSDDIRLQK